MAAFRTLDDAGDLKGKRVLLRVDLNVPVKDGAVTDATRIERVAPTIKELSDRGAKVALLAHFERPKGKRVPELSLAPIAPGGRRSDRPAGRLRRRLHRAGGRGGSGEARRRRHRAPGKHPLPCRARRRTIPAFAAALAKVGDVYVNDAFSAAHRAHASTEGVAHLLPAYAGRAMQEELEALEKALSQSEPPGARHRRRRQDLHQAGAARQSHPQGGRAGHRRRHGEHVPCRQGRRDRQVAERAGPRRRRGRSCSRRRMPVRAIVLPADVVAASEFKANAPHETVTLDRVPPDRDDPRRRREDGRGRSTAGSTRPRRWSGTGRSAPSRRSPSTAPPSRRRSTRRSARAKASSCRWRAAATRSPR